MWRILKESHWRCFLPQKMIQSVMTFFHSVPWASKLREDPSKPWLFTTSQNSPTQISLLPTLVEWLLFSPMTKFSAGNQSLSSVWNVFRFFKIQVRRIHLLLVQLAFRDRLSLWTCESSFWWMGLDGSRLCATLARVIKLFIIIMRSALLGKGIHHQFKVV